MSDNMNMIFEVADLAVASPATVSRCGMVYLEPHQLGWRPLCLSWIASFPEHIDKKFRERVLGLFDWLVPVSIRFLKRELKEAAATTAEGTNVAVNLMRTFKSLLVDPMSDPKAYTKEFKKEMELHVDSTIIFAATWSLGGSAASNEGRAAFDLFFRAAFEGRLDKGYAGPSGETYDLPEDIPEGHLESQTPLPPTTLGARGGSGGDNSAEEGAEETGEKPAGATLYDFRWDVATKSWTPWEDMIDRTPIPKTAAFKSIIVPTVDTVRYLFLADLAVRSRNPILFCGPTGTGKSVYLQGHLMGMDKAEYAPPNFIGFSAKTSANITQYLIDAKFAKIRKGTTVLRIPGRRW